jgi:site-specific recombinase XerD
MTDKTLFIRVLEKNGDRLYFLSCTKCRRTKEDYPHYLWTINLKNENTKLPLVLNKEEVEKIPNSIYNIKHKAILVLIYSSGLRVGEAVNMER